MGRRLNILLAALILQAYPLMVLHALKPLGMEV